MQKFVVEANGCWIWTAAVNEHGYGVLYRGPSVGGETQNVLAHVYAFETRRGKIEDGFVLDHLCRNRRCCNPDHVEPVTQATNMIRGSNRNIAAKLAGTCVRGHKQSEHGRFAASGKRRGCYLYCTKCRKDKAASTRSSSCRS